MPIFNWTKVKATFDIPDTSLPLYVIEAFDNAFRTLNLCDSNEEPSWYENVHSSSIVDAILKSENYKKEAEEDDDDNPNKYLPVNNIDIKVPILPYAPKSSAGGLSYSISYNERVHVKTVTVEGILRDFGNESTPYLKWWFKMISRILSTPVLYSYKSSGRERVIEYEDNEEHNDTKEVIKEYVEIVAKWWKKWNDYKDLERAYYYTKACVKARDVRDDHVLTFLIESFKEGNKPDWQKFIIEQLEEKDKV